MLKKSTYYLNSLDEFIMLDRKRSQSWRAGAIGKAMSQYRPRSQKRGSPRRKGVHAGQHSCKQVRITYGTVGPRVPGTDIFPASDRTVDRTIWENESASWEAGLVMKHSYGFYACNWDKEEYVAWLSSSSSLGERRVKEENMHQWPVTSRNCATTWI